MNGFALFSLAMVAQMGVVIARAEDDAVAVDPYPNGRVVQYSFTLSNSSDRTITNAQLWAYLPVPQTSYQRRRALYCSHPYTLEKDDRGNEILHVVIASLPSAATELVVISTSIGLRSEPVSALPAGEIYLKPEPYVEIDEPAFRQLAPRYEAATAQELAQTVQAWTIGHMKGRRYTAAERGALYALQTRDGDCSEYAYLFVALCRAHGVPARVLGGYRHKGGVLRPASYHNWAEYHDGTTWRMADPYARVFDHSASLYVAMRIAGSATNSIQPFPQFRGEGDGLIVTMNDP